MSCSATSNEEFSTREYWEKRYQDEYEESFDWFKTYDELKDLFHELIPNRSHRILMLGCGNSTLSRDMFLDGYQNIINIDYSSVVIQKMSQQFPEMKWIEMDITELQNPINLDKLGGLKSFDIVIDKGTMDALLAEKGSVWSPSERVVERVKSEINGVVDLLKPSTGTFIYLTFGQPHFRKPHLERPENWQITVQTIGDMFHYYLYICRMK